MTPSPEPSVLLNEHGLSPVVEITRDLIRIDTSNYTDGHAEPEAPAADYVEALLTDVGLSCRRFEAEPGRTNLVARWEGTDPEAPALLLHAHLDVVPADPAAWTHGPFEGDIADGMLWGRGAVDMKNMIAMIVAAVRALIVEGFRPRRDVVLAFFADEEAGSKRGSDWMVRTHPEQFAGVRDAIGEGGGYSVNVNGQRAYLMNTGEKGLLFLTATAHGLAGHGSLPALDNPIPKIAAAVSSINAIEWPIDIGATTAALLERLRLLAGKPVGTDPLELAAIVGPSAPRIRAGLRTVANVTMMNAGYKESVVPESATAVIDSRYLPGHYEATIARIAEAAGPDVELTTTLHLPAIESTFDGEVIDIIQQTIGEKDPGAVVLPHLIPGATDAKSLRPLGITGYGFIPLLLPEDFAFPAMFHGIDERVPLESLDFGAGVLEAILRRC